MRLLIIPFILIAMLVQASGPALGNNQEAAEKIAQAIGNKFPDADINVAYQGGQVGLAGEAVSQDQRRQIAEYVQNIPGVNVTVVSNEIQVAAAKAAAAMQAQLPARRPPVAALTDPAPIPSRTPAPAARQGQPVQAPQTGPGAALPQYTQQHYPAAYGVHPGQHPAVGAPFAPVQHAMPAQPMQQHPAPHQQAHHGQMAGQYHQAHLPEYAWPAYANYPNYAQVSYPRAYSPQAWPYIGPFYPYPQVPMDWRKVTLEFNNGNWWLDFDDGTPSGPFSGLFRQPQQYTY
ncbi:MAG: BON domain-containing protein [Planctomycetaceae bacterium]|nr:BON domain-containing protein [Planctomycetaceae bacterium]